ncbi:MAG: carbamate kinase [Pseudomonadales bacterium]|nr:carbamate kinase [Pseudomonadales bacterium]
MHGARDSLPLADAPGRADDPPRPLLVVAVGGNALSAPQRADDPGLVAERRAAAQTGAELAALAARGYRLLVVHGNGPQVGRLLRADPDLGLLDVHVAQTQGELGYLLAAAFEQASREPMAALVTRVEVDAADPRGHDPEKPVGAVLAQDPGGAARRTPDGAGWRRVVPSPWPRAVRELPVIARMLGDCHVIAGGGGGVPVTAAGLPVAGVVDKDRVAALLAIRLDAAGLVIGTDVAGVYRDFGGPAPTLLRTLDVSACRALLESGALPAGSMGPKVAAALDFVLATGRPAAIGGLGELGRVWSGSAGTRVLPQSDSRNA